MVFKYEARMSVRCEKHKIQAWRNNHKNMTKYDC